MDREIESAFTMAEIIADEKEWEEFRKTILNIVEYFVDQQTYLNQDGCKYNETNN